jgi:hypothetical protein
MGLLIAFAKAYVPQFIRKRKLEMLFSATADAFQVTAPSVRELSYTDSLKIYAQFTREQAEKAIHQGAELKVQPRLFRNAYRIGQQFKRDFNINTADEALQMGTVIYKMLKIEFQGEPRGYIVIKHCFFSAYYSDNICRLISSLDEGSLTGLSGGGQLSFTQRITEGHECCRAYLEPPRRLQ